MVGDDFDLLAQIVRITSSSADINERLDAIVASVAQHLQLYFATFFGRDKQELLRQLNSWPREMRTHGLVSPAGQSSLDKVIYQREPSSLAANQAQQDPVLQQLLHPGESVVLIPIMDAARVYGILVLAIPEGRKLKDQDMRLLQIIGREVSGIFRDYDLRSEAKRRLTESNIYAEFGRMAITSVDPKVLLQKIAAAAAQLLHCESALVVVCYDGETADSRWSLYNRFGNDSGPAQQCIDNCLTAATGIAESPALCQEVWDDDYALCTRLYFKGLYQGSICAFNKLSIQDQQRVPFDANDSFLLDNLASMAGPTLNNALNFHDLQVVVRQNKEILEAQAMLLDVGAALLSEMDYKQRLLTVLYVLIHPEGLTYDQALFFLNNEADHEFLPVAGLDKKKAGLLKPDLSSTLSALRDAGTQFIAQELSIEDPSLQQLKLVLQTRDQEPLSETLHALINQRRPVIINNHAELQALTNGLMNIAGSYPFILLPMFAHNRLIGLLLVRNSSSHRVISNQELGYLEMLANLAGFALENARLFEHLQTVNSRLSQMQERLTQVQRLDALKDVMDRLAHEIRTPMVSIGGFTRLIRRKLQTDSSLLSYLDVITNETDRMEQVLKEMLDVPADDPDNYRSYDLAEIMNNALAFLTKELEDAQVTVYHEVTPDLPPVVCDESQIIRAFLNIFLNGVQALENAPIKELRLKTSLQTKFDKHYVVAEISDTGTGFDLDLIDKIFFPFFTTKESARGMGLYNAYLILKHHNGWIEPHNNALAGATFLVGLPAAEKTSGLLR